MITAPTWSRIMQVVIYKFNYLSIVKIELFLFFASPFLVLLLKYLTVDGI